MKDASPYIFDEGPSLVHIRRRIDGQCIADIRLDAYLILVEEIRRQAFAEAMDAARKSAGGSHGTV